MGASKRNMTIFESLKLFSAIYRTLRHDEECPQDHTNCKRDFPGLLERVHCVCVCVWVGVWVYLCVCLCLRGGKSQRRDVRGALLVSLETMLTVPLPKAAWR
jgi:hypothetical protein